MGFWKQLYLLSWKNFTLRKRQKYHLLVELIAPLVLFLILVGIRTSPGLKTFHHECHFNGKAMPSAGLFPFLQSFFCNFNNTCYKEMTPTESMGTVDSFNQSIFTQLASDIEDLFNNHLDKDTVTDLYKDIQIASTLQHKIKNGSTTGEVKVANLFTNLTTIREELKEKGVKFTLVEFIQLMNASIDFQKVHLSNLNTALRSFDSCPGTESFQQDVLSAMSHSTLCSSYGLLGNLQFYPDSAKANLTSKICGLTNQQKTDLLIVFRSGFSIQKFVLQMVKFTFINTKQFPNINRIFTNLRNVYTSIKSMKSLKHPKIKATFEKLIQSTLDNGSLNTSSIVQALGQFVCGDHSFLQVQSEKPSDLLSRFIISGTKDYHAEASYNEYGPNAPVCRKLVNVMNSDPNTKMLWRYLKAVVLGKIPYTPDTPAVLEVIKMANRTFSDLADIIDIAKKWESYVDNLQEYLKQSHGFGLIQSFSGSCLCNLMERKSLKQDVTEQNSVTCKFLREFFTNNNNTVNLDKMLVYSKVLAKLIADYGQCIVFDKFVPYPSEKDLVKNSLGMIQNRTFLAAVVFNVDKRTPNKLPKHVSYKIRMDTDRVDNTKQVTDRFWTPGPRSRPGPQTKYLTYGFAYLQDMIEQAIIKIQTGMTNNIGLVLQQFPYPCYIEDSFMYGISKTLPLFLVLAWLFPVAMICKNIVYEKEMRLKEVMKIMGLGNGVHWLAWFINAFSIMFLTVCLLVIILKLGGVIEHTDASILLVFLTVYGISTIMQCFLITVFFNQANLCACCASFIYFALYLPYLLARHWEHLMSLDQKLAVSLSSNVAFGFGCTYISRFEEQAVGMQWSNINTSPVPDDQFNMYLCIMMMLSDAAIYGVLTWYIEAVFPGSYGLPRPWYFPLQPSYWCGISVCRYKEEEDPKTDNNKDAPKLEEEPHDRPLGVSIKNLKKCYKKGKKNAVDGLSVNFYEGQITSFLGHNGAGKTTTMSILTGLFPPSQGSAYIYGQNILTDMDKIRNNLGMCPQFNVLFKFLTVEEHIWFYTSLKGKPNKQAHAECDRMMRETGLYHRSQEFPDQLSGGMKRKLSIAIAFVGDAKTVILDEPTAGVDPQARRAIWELLIKFKKNRTIILSTHHMDEADILGDRIAIISQGRLLCCGSSLYLKSQYGNGYYLTMVKDGNLDSDSLDRQRVGFNRQLSDILDEGFLETIEKSEGEATLPLPVNGPRIMRGYSKKRISAFVKKYIRRAKLVEDNSTEVIFQLPPESARDGYLEMLFEMLENCHEDLGISSYGISDTCLEEVFLKVAEEDDDHTDEFKRQKLEEVTDGGRIARPVTQLSFKRNKKRSFLRSISEENRLGTDEIEIEVSTETEEQFTHKHDELANGCLLWWKQIGAILLKRFQHFKRSKKGFVCEVVMPALFILIAMLFSETNPPYSDPPPLEIYPWHLIPNKGDHHLYMFYSNDRPGSRLGDRSEDVLLSKYGIGNTCLQDYQSKSLPCDQNMNVTDFIRQTMNTNTVECSCSSGVQECPAELPEPPKQMLYSNDYLYNMTGRNVSDWLVKTNHRYMSRRYGGLSFGSEIQDIHNNSEHVSSVLQSLLDLNLTDHKLVYQHTQIWSKVMELKSHFNTDNINKVWYNNKGWISVVAYMNLMNNIILRSNLPSNEDPSEYGITAFTHPLAPTKQQSQHQAQFNNKADIVVAICIIFAMSFIPASFVMTLIEERASYSKHLQFISGVTPFVYWITNFVWDLINYTICTCLCLLIFLAFKREAYIGLDNLPCLVSLLLLYGYAMIPVMYPFSRYFSVPSTAMVILKSVNIFLGTTSTLAIFVLELLAEEDQTLKDINDKLHEALLFLPQFCLGRGLLDLSRNQVYKDAFKKFDTAGATMKNPLEWDMSGKNLVSMAVIGTAFFIINILIEYRIFYKTREVKARHEETDEEDEDVAKERVRVLAGGASDEILTIQNLTKVYQLTGSKGKHTAVDRVCLGVPEGQCFGLLGVNGAGKTTMFKMLTGALNITEGNAYIKGESIKSNKLQRDIGYCPQFDAVDSLLTGREVLKFYARLRGIPEKDVKQVADWGIKKLGLVQYADKLCGCYSGGNKRKLSTAMALIANPSLIFLDEPTTGMDPKARRFLWTCINNIVKEGRSVVLTSHSMEECEALCDRLSIMVNGRFRCLGSTQHLKNRFGDGYTLLLRISGEEPDLTSVENFITKTFSSAILKESHYNMLQYQLKSEIKLSYVFGQIESARQLLNIEDYSVSQTTLDQVFINFAKIQTDLYDEEFDSEKNGKEKEMIELRTVSINSAEVKTGPNGHLTLKMPESTTKL
ncbi:phospholipid-transporting ATPase ABCA1-like [Mytilus trossulus]|uniref:phospholipid-transporting ATPase ABCA1-like n=1 Tax=Mytilus trossulus TaxID=6551 RepID=UPI003003F03C